LAVSAVLTVALLFAALLPAAAHACDALVGTEYQDPPEWIEIDVDKATWHVAMRAVGQTYARQELVPSGETMMGWTELYSWNVSFGKRGRFDLETIQTGLIRALEQQCKSFETRTIREEKRDRIIEWSHDGCYGRPASHEIMRLIEGEIGLHTLLYGHKGKMPKADREAWIARLSKATLSRRIPMEGDLPELSRAKVAMWSGDYVAAIAMLSPMAEAGEPEAQTLVAGLHAEGWGLPQDYAKAREWLTKAAPKHPPAAYQLARFYDNGWGVDADPAEAQTWYRSAADRGHAEAMGRLGYLIANETGERRDPKAAFALFERAAEEGHSHALYWLGRLIEQDKIGGRPFEEALDLYRKSARDGERDAQLRMGQLYADGVGVARDDAAARTWLVRAAMQGDQEAARILAQRYGGLGGTKPASGTAPAAQGE
jgi:hypothetical protein